MARVCGPCTECCTVLGVTAIAKPAHEPCPHCTKGLGCHIYQDRPLSCARFRCLWLTGEGDRAMRPDRTHAVLTLEGNPGLGRTVFVHIHPAHPDAGEKEPLKGTLARYFEAGYDIIYRWKGRGKLRSRNPAVVLTRLQQLGLALDQVGAPTGGPDAV